MTPHIETMSLLQRLVQAGAPAAPGASTNITELRNRVPAPVLAHFDRLLAQGKTGVAEVRHGVCGACHLRLPAAVTSRGADHEDLQLCENCGAYLVFPGEEEPVAKPDRPRRYRAVALA
ncbi:MAG: hypothetical protein ACHQ5A_02320 [Opitutales bacterium]